MSGMIPMQMVSKMMVRADLANVTVTLNETGATVDTDENGSYQFCGLKPGTYSVTVDKNDLPAGYIFTTQNVDGNTSEDKDSDVDSDGKSDSVTITDDNITSGMRVLIITVYVLEDYHSWEKDWINMGWVSQGLKN